MNWNAKIGEGQDSCGCGFATVMAVMLLTTVVLWHWIGIPGALLGALGGAVLGSIVALVVMAIIDSSNE